MSKWVRYRVDVPSLAADALKNPETQDLVARYFAALTKAKRAEATIVEQTGNRVKVMVKVYGRTLGWSDTFTVSLGDGRLTVAGDFEGLPDTARTAAESVAGIIAASEAARRILQTPEAAGMALEEVVVTIGGEEVELEVERGGHALGIWG